MATIPLTRQVTRQWQNLVERFLNRETALEALLWMPMPWLERQMLMVQLWPREIYLLESIE